eukprot:UN00497
MPSNHVLQAWHASYVKNMDLSPKVQTRYVRSAYETQRDSESHEPCVRITIDSDIQAIKVCDLSYEQLRSQDFSTLTPECTLSFPLCVVEVKYTGMNLESERLIQTMEDSNLIFTCEDFSKFAAGVAVHFPEDVLKVPQWTAPWISLKEAKRGVLMKQT